MGSASLQSIPAHMHAAPVPYPSWSASVQPGLLASHTPALHAHAPQAAGPSFVSQSAALVHAVPPPPAPPIPLPELVAPPPPLLDPPPAPLAELLELKRVSLPPPQPCTAAATHRSPETRPQRYTWR